MMEISQKNLDKMTKGMKRFISYAEKYKNISNVLEEIWRSNFKTDYFIFPFPGSNTEIELSHDAVVAELEKHRKELKVMMIEEFETNISGEAKRPQGEKECNLESTKVL